MLIQALTLAVALQWAPGEMRLMRYPTVHGESVVFTYAGDLWTSKLDGGFARRLTSHAGNEARARFSPDGKSLAFTATYDGNADVYVMPAEGGEPVRLTYEPDADVVLNWTPDGKIAYSSTYGSFTNRQERLWLVDPKGGLPKETPLHEVADVSYSPDGRKLAYNRSGSHEFNWRRYRGGTQGKISFWDFATSTYTELPAGKENSWEPMWVGDTVYYISDKNQGTVNLYAHELASKRTQQLTTYNDSDIKWPSTDGKTITFERDGYLFAFDIASKKISKVVPTLRGDMLSARASMRELGNSTGDFSLSPSGVRLIVEARGDLFSVPVKNGDTRNFTESQGVRENNPSWSPDGKSIAYLSDESGEMQIYTRPQMGGTADQLTSEKTRRIASFNWSPKGDKIAVTTLMNEVLILDVATKAVTPAFAERFGGAPPFDWSPDGKWIACVIAGDNLQGAIHLFNVESSKLTKVTDGYFNDATVSFDLNGKFLYFISSRTFNPTPGDFEFIMQMEDSQRIYVLPLSKDQTNPLLDDSDEEKTGDEKKPDEKKPDEKANETTIDFEGLGDRALALPMPPGSYPFVVGADNGLFFYSSGSLMKFDFATKTPAPIIAGATSFDWNAKRTKLAYQAGNIVGVIDARPGQKAGDGRVSMSDVETVVDPRAEWKQIFWEAWRYQRDRFYDKDMLGLDWNAIGKKYEAYLPYVSHRADLNYVMGLMNGELGTSHAYVGGGDTGATTNVPTGVLGADYESHSNKIRFKKIYRGLNFEEGRRGPLGEPGVNIKEGEYLLAIDGKELGANSNPHALLVNKVGRSVTLTVNDRPGMTGAREVRVRPLSSESQLRYIEWVEGNRKAVSEASGGRIGYMHVPDTSMPGVIEFIKGYYSQSDKDALIVDERFNGGGMIPTFFVERLGRTVDTALKQRRGEDVSFPPQTIQGPMAMLINGYAGSGGDMLPWLFKNAKVGPLIGTRTWGGLVGIQGSAALVDGGFFTSPEFGIYDLKTGKWIAENTGVDADIEVDARPDLVAQGKDPQLEKAVEYLLGELKKGKAGRKAPATFPKVPPPGK